MPKIRNVSGVDRVLADGRLVRADEVVSVSDADTYVSQEATWAPVDSKKESD